MLRVLEGALAVSEYTDKVFSYRSNKPGCIQQQLGDMFAVLSGMLVVAKGKKGQDLIQNRQVSENPELFASIFEVGRRYKVMNPDKMRSSHGKLMYMLMDASMSEVRESMGFSCVRKIVTVEEELRALALRPSSTRRIRSRRRPSPYRLWRVGGGQGRRDGTTSRAYGGEGDGGGGGSGAKPQGVAAAARKARVERVLLSIADDAVLTEAHVAPVEEMLQLLRDNYSPSAPADKHSSLAISAGRNGARLSHCTDAVRVRRAISPCARSSPTSRGCGASRRLTCSTAPAIGYATRARVFIGWPWRRRACSCKRGHQMQQQVRGNWVAPLPCIGDNAERLV